ncbi:fibronectin type III domain-containing protein, partial [bacterium]|nr:fibronectin type III domain-containing protein [bacterium]
GSTWTTFADEPSTATSATVTGLTNGTAYVFRVAAVNAVGPGAYTAASSSVTPSAAPTLTKLTNGTNGSFTGNGTAADPFVAATYQGGSMGAVRFTVSQAATLRILYNSDSEDLPAFEIYNDAGGNSLVSGDAGTNISKTYAMSANQIVRIVANYGALQNLRVWAT